MENQPQNLGLQPEKKTEEEITPEQQRKNEIREMKDKYLALGKELSESGKIFIFPDISRETYDGIKKVQEEYPQEEYLRVPIPIDDIIGKLKLEGMRVVVITVDVYVIPYFTGAVEDEGLFPRQLEIVEEMDEKLKQLITLQKELYNKIKNR